MNVYERLRNVENTNSLITQRGLEKTREIARALSGLSLTDAEIVLALVRNFLVQTSITMAVNATKEDEEDAGRNS